MRLDDETLAKYADLAQFDLQLHQELSGMAIELIGWRKKAAALADHLYQEADTLEHPQAVYIRPLTQEAMGHVNFVRERYAAAQCNHVSIRLRELASVLARDSKGEPDA